jgi:hypothetical protein
MTATKAAWDYNMYHPKQLVGGLHIVLHVIELSDLHTGRSPNLWPGLSKDIAEFLTIATTVGSGVGDAIEMLRVVGG